METFPAMFNYGQRSCLCSRFMIVYIVDHKRPLSKPLAVWLADTSTRCRGFVLTYGVVCIVRGARTPMVPLNRMPPFSRVQAAEWAVPIAGICYSPVQRTHLTPPT